MNGGKNVKSNDRKLNRLLMTEVQEEISRPSGSKRYLEEAITRSRCQ